MGISSSVNFPGKIIALYLETDLKFIFQIISNARTLKYQMGNIPVILLCSLVQPPWDFAYSYIKVLDYYYDIR